jgi:hypothetical protein
LNPLLTVLANHQGRPQNLHPISSLKIWIMKNTNDCNKNKDEVSSPEQKKIVAKAKNKSKHRINYFEWTIRLIRAMFRLQINSIVLKLKEISAASKKSTIIKNLQFHIRKSGSLLKKKTKVKRFTIGSFIVPFFHKCTISIFRFKNQNYRLQNQLPPFEIFDIQGSCPQFIKRNHAIFFFRLKLRCVTDNVKCFVSFKMGRV